MSIVLVGDSNEGLREDKEIEESQNKLITSQIALDSLPDSLAIGLKNDDPIASWILKS